jgi:hypothetical protein
MPVKRPNVLKWAPVIDAELARVNSPFPRDLILAVIDVESRGKAGLLNPKSGASGLMQVMPGTLDDYNQRHPSDPVSLAELRSSSVPAAVKQIRVGLSVLSHYWRGAYHYLSDRWSHVPIDELARVADLFYVAGPGNTRDRLNMIDNPTWAAIQARFPKWNALPHPRNVFALLEGLTWPTEQIAAWLDSPPSKFDPSPKQGLFISMLAILAAWWMMKGRKG